MAQLGRALALGARGREFESHSPDQIYPISLKVKRYPYKIDTVERYHHRVPTAPLAQFGMSTSLTWKVSGVQISQGVPVAW